MILTIFTVMLTVIMLNVFFTDYLKLIVVMQSIPMLSDIMLSIIMLSDIILSVIMLNVFMLSVIKLNAVMLSFVMNVAF
jgi:hypothetical protein